MAHELERTPAAVLMGDVDLLRPLLLAGVPVALVAQPGRPARWSRHLAERLVAHDPEDAPDALVAELIGYARGRTDAPVLFYESDDQLLFVSRHRDRLAAHLRFLLPPATTVERLVDKAGFVDLASELCLPVPPSVALPAGDGVGARRAAAELGYPLLVKPRRRQASWNRRRQAKAVRVGDADELTRLVEVETPTTELLLQVLVSGGEERIETYHVYVDADGDVRAEFTGRKLRTTPARFGHTTALTITDAVDVRALGRDVVGRLGLRGVAKLDLKRDPDGRLWLLEVNPRFTLWHHAGARAGCNVPAIVHADLTGRPHPRTARIRVGTTWCLPWTDVRAARRDGTSLAAWLRWYATCDARSVVSLQDPGPFVAGTLVPKLAGRRA